MDKSLESCGYCKVCVRRRVMKAVGRTPETALECAYKHILDSYSTALGSRPGASPGVLANPPSSPGDSCSTNCRWTSSGSSSKPSYDDMNFNDDDDYSHHLYRKRIKFVKRKKVWADAAGCILYQSNWPPSIGAYATSRRFCVWLSTSVIFLWRYSMIPSRPLAVPQKCYIDCFYF